VKRTFRAQLDFNSIIKFSATLGFGSGILISVITFLPYYHSGELMMGLLMFILTPLATAIGAVITGSFGFPFYWWYCNKVGGQHISGKFAEESE
jgi:hypothetical protein